jgi:hypothetical protein
MARAAQVSCAKRQARKVRRLLRDEEAARTQCHIEERDRSRGV